MSRFVCKVVAAIVSLGSIAILSGGCIEAEGRIFIEGFPVPDEQGFCPVDAETFVSRGAVLCDDETCIGGLCVQVRNQMTESLANSSNNNNVETGEVILHSYDLRYIADGVDLSEADATINITMPVPPEGLATVGISLINGASAQTLAQTLDTGLIDMVVGLRFYGRTTGGLEVETPETFIGVTVQKL